MARSYRVLTESDIEHFHAFGHIVVKQAFSRELAMEKAAFGYTRLGVDPKDPATWTADKVHMPGRESFEYKVFAPKAWDAICDLMGGEERIKQPACTSDGFIANFRLGADRPYVKPSPEAGGWHKDGDFFRHFLDSWEQGLLGVVCWSDILPESGGTYIACDSVKPVAEALVCRPEGVRPSEFGFGKLVAQCKDFREVTGMAGDIVLLHPYMLHASSQNPSGRPRLITNPTVQLREPMNFNRENPDDFSPVEESILRALGVPRLDFQITQPRETIVPARIAMQQKLKDEENARLAAIKAAESSTPASSR